jgi:ubiquinone/menaquinone biosynthesis C-methylase UbiE
MIRKSMNLLKIRLGAASGGKILDVATEGGDFIRRLIDAFNDYSDAIGIDICDEHFKEARKDFKGARVSFRKMDGVDLLFEDETFDTVSISTGLHHLAEIMPVLLEMKRVLKSGGRFIIREQFRDFQSKKQLSDVYQHHWGAKIDRIEGKTHNPTLKKKEIIDIVENLDLTNYEAQEYICRECDPEKDGKVESTLASMDEDLARISGHPQYERLKKEGERIRKRIRNIGFACATHLDIIGIK